MQAGRRLRWWARLQIPGVVSSSTCDKAHRWRPDLVHCSSGLCRNRFLSAGWQALTPGGRLRDRYSVRIPESVPELTRLHMYQNMYQPCTGPWSIDTGVQRCRNAPQPKPRLRVHKKYVALLLRRAKYAVDPESDDRRSPPRRGSARRPGFFASPMRFHRVRAGVEQLPACSAAPSRQSAPDQKNRTGTVPASGALT